MKRYLLTIVFALIIGFFLGNFLLKQYKDYESIMVSKSGNEVYFFQYGIYSDLNSMEQNTINLENYIYKIDDNKYYVYVAMTKNKDNVQKIKDYFSSLGYETIIKKYNLANDEFDTILFDLDSIINQTEDQTVIASIISEGLKKYEEVVNNGSKN